MDKSKMLWGLHYGEHTKDPVEVFEHLKKYGKDTNLAMIRTPFEELADPEYYYEIARYCKEQGIYFCFLYTQGRAPKGQVSHLSKDIVEKLYEIAGEYFLGDNFGELGCSIRIHMEQTGYQLKDMQEARDYFVSFIRKKVEVDRAMGIRNLFAVESHTLQKYGLEAGLDMACCELLLGNPEHILAFTRGAARGYGKEEFGGYIAHEWYGGIRHGDPLKNKRLGLMYRYAYLAGVNQLYLESGFEGVGSYGVKEDEDWPYCRMVREEVAKFGRYVQENPRPARGPLVKVAFVSGHLDGYAGHSNAYGGVASSVWGQHNRKEWGKSAPEHSFRILDDVYRSCDWHDPINYGDMDYSAAPAYGQYDMLPAEAPAEVMGRYDWLIFTGWNTMTEEIYENLKTYVREGGNLLISAAHMKTSVVRGSDGPYIHDGKVSDFLGCQLTGRKFTSNKGYKFVRDSIVEGLYYPGTVNYTEDPIDPIGADGYTSYAVIKEEHCSRAVFLSEWFFGTHRDYYEDGAVLVEHAYGKGNVLFMTTEEYPGAPGVYSLYKIIVKSILASTHRKSDIKVIGSDRVRFAVYEDEEKYRVYLLNTDLNSSHKMKVYYRDACMEQEVEATEMEFVDLIKE